MLSISLSSRFSALVPNFVGAFIEISVRNAPTSSALLAEIETCVSELRRRTTADTLKSSPPIAATRAAYKACGKDPSRYRPACEQLARRVLQGKSLYTIDTLVDIGNLVSLLSGYSTGLIDADKLKGAHLTLDVGRADEPYDAIGRGPLNIEGLPAYRDAEGYFATPTSDSTRTMLSATTTRLLFIINGYDGNRTAIARAVEQALVLLRDYADGREERVEWF